LSLALDRSLTQDVELALDFTLDIALDSTLDSTLDLAHSLEVATDCARRVAIDLVPSLEESLRDLLSAADPVSWQRAEWPIRREVLRAVSIRSRDIGHEWKFTRQQEERLSDYYKAHLLLAECIKVARGLTTKIRRGIESRMLQISENS